MYFLSSLALAFALTPTIPVQDVSYQPPSAFSTQATLLPDGTLLVARSDGLILAVNADTGEPSPEEASNSTGYYRNVYALHLSGVYHLTVDPRGEILAAASEDGRIALWSLDADHGATGYPNCYSPEVFLTPSPASWRGVSDVAWTHDGSHLMTWSGGYRPGWTPTTAVKLWSLEGDLVWTGPRALSAAVSPIANRMAVLVEDEVLLMWPGTDDKKHRVEGASFVAFSPDGKRLAVGGEGSRLWIIDVKSGKVLLEEALDVGDPFQERMFAAYMSWSPNGKWLGISLGKGFVPVVIDPTDGSTVWSGGFQGGRMWAAFRVNWTPDNRLV